MGQELDALYIATAHRVDLMGIEALSRAEYVLMSVWYAVGMVGTRGFAGYFEKRMPLAELSDTLCAISAFPAAQVVERLRLVVGPSERMTEGDRVMATVVASLEAEFRKWIPGITRELASYVAREGVPAGRAPDANPA